MGKYSYLDDRFASKCEMQFVLEDDGPASGSLGDAPRVLFGPILH